MKDFVKRTKMEAGKLSNTNRTSITNEVPLDSSNRLTTDHQNQGWINLRYKLLKTRWNDAHIKQDKPMVPIQVDKVIKEPPTYFLTARPHRQESVLDNSEQTKKLERKDRSMSGSSAQLNKRPASARTEQVAGITPVNRLHLPIQRKTKPKERPKPVTSFTQIDKKPYSEKLKDKVMNVVSTVKTSQVSDDKLAHASNNTERSTNQFNNITPFPDKDRRPDSKTRPKNMVKRLSSGSALSYRSKMSSIAELEEEKINKKVIKALPAKSRQPDNDRSKEVEDDSLSRSSSPSRNSDQSSGDFNEEPTPKVVVLQQQEVIITDQNRYASFRYSRDGEAILKKLRSRGTTVDFNTEILENSEYRHVFYVDLVHEDLFLFPRHHYGQRETVRLQENKVRQ